MIAIIGGGISGLSLAYFLTRQGLQVVVFEKEDRLGGTCRSIRLGDKVVDAFYHVLTGGRNPLTELIAEVGLESSLFPVRITQAFFSDGKIYGASSVRDFLFLSALGPLDRMRLGVTAINALLTRVWQPLDLITAREWLIKVGGKKLFERFWLPIMICKFGEAVDRVSAADMWFRIRRLGEVSLGCDKSRGTVYIRGTLRALFDALEERLNAMGAKIFKGTAVDRLLVEGSRVKGIYTGIGVYHAADKVVSTVPLPDLCSILPAEMESYRTRLARIEYLHNVSLILKTRKPIIPYYQLNLGHTDMPYTGIIGADCFYPPEEYGGYVTYFTRYFMGREDLFCKTPEQLVRHYQPYIQRVNPDFSPDWVQEAAISCGRNVEPLHTVGYSHLIPEQQAPVDGLFLLSTSQIYPEPTIIDVTVAHASEQARRIVQGNKLGESRHG